MLRAIDSMNNLELSMTMGHKLNAIDTMKNPGLWLTWMTLGCQLKALGAMQN